MSNMHRRNLLKAGMALPLALNTLKLRASDNKGKPPRRIIFICNSLGFLSALFFSKESGGHQHF